MSAKRKLRKMALGLRNKTERKEDIIVKHPPKITRIGRIRFRRDPASFVESHGVITTCRTLKSYCEKIRRSFPHAQIVHVDRAWVVSLGAHSVDQWTYLLMAQAQRDGFNYHYARYLMTRGTAAEGT